MKVIINGHRSGMEVVPDVIIQEICNELNKVVYAIKDFRKLFPIRLKGLGWSDNIYLDSISKINITSMRDDIGLCIQTGNVSRIYADLLKLQALYLRGSIKGGIIILPSKAAARSFGGNVATLERLERELPIFNQVITMPMVIIGFCE